MNEAPWEDETPVGSSRFLKSLIIWPSATVVRRGRHLVQARAQALSVIVQPLPVWNGSGLVVRPTI